VHSVAAAPVLPGLVLAPRGALFANAPESCERADDGSRHGWLSGSDSRVRLRTNRFRLPGALGSTLASSLR